MANWKIDQAELQEVIDFLGLEYPVDIQPTDESFVGKYHGIGFYGTGARGERREVPTHSISIEADLSASMASSLAWHELTHAAQCESFMPDQGYDGLERWQIGMRDFTEAYAQESRRTGGYGSGSSSFPTSSYTGISFEKEASANMKYADEVAPIVPVNDEDEEDEVSAPSYDQPVWRVDYIQQDGNWARTFYVLAKEDWKAKRWARDKIPGSNYQDDCYAYRVPTVPAGVKLNDGEEVGE